MIGVTRSPRPLPTAVAPVREKGTSAPRRAARAESSGRVRFVPHRALQATRVAAASAEPPAMPPATGTRLRRRRSTPSFTPVASARSSAARTARLEASVGTASLGSSRVRVTVPWSWADWRRAVTVSMRRTAWKTVVSGW